jgi:hypothetical protein
VTYLRLVIATALAVAMSGCSGCDDPNAPAPPRAAPREASAGASGTGFPGTHIAHFPPNVRFMKGRGAEGGEGDESLEASSE